MEVKKDGRTIPAIAVMSKASLLFLLDRVTGKPIYEIKEMPVPTDTDMIGEAPSPTQPMSVTPPLGRTTFDMSELANLTPQQKAGCDKIIQVHEHRGRANSCSRSGWIPAWRAFPAPGAASTGAMPPSIPQTGNYIVNICDMASPQVMVRKPDGTYDMRDGYQWFWDKVSHMPCQAPPWGELVCGGCEYRRASSGAACSA